MPSRRTTWLGQHPIQAGHRTSNILISSIVSSFLQFNISYPTIWITEMHGVNQERQIAAMQATPKIKLTIKKNRIVEEESSLTPEQESTRQREQLEAKFLTAIDCLWQMELRAGDVQEDNREFLVNDMYVYRLCAHNASSDLGPQLKLWCCRPVRIWSSTTRTSPHWQHICTRRYRRML